MKQFYFPTICMMGLILLLSCQSKQTSQALIPETETPPAPAKTLSEAIASYKFIPLATDDTTLVGNITKILKYKELYQKVLKAIFPVAFILLIAAFYR